MSPNFVYVILAAGSGSRIGFDKATTPLAGTSPLARLANVVRGARVVVVANAANVAACEREMPDAFAIVNHEPERGMTGSLRVANREISPASILGVLLADKPFVSRETLALGEAAFADMAYEIAYPRFRGEPGHPVYFAGPARAAIPELPDGDTLRIARDDERFRRFVYDVEDQGAAIDLDTPEAWADAEKQLRAMDETAGGG